MTFIDFSILTFPLRPWCSIRQNTCHSSLAYIYCSSLVSLPAHPSLVCKIYQVTQITISWYFSDIPLHVSLGCFFFSFPQPSMSVLSSCFHSILFPNNAQYLHFLPSMISTINVMYVTAYSSLIVHNIPR